ncbi:hypothetical protein [Streptomyces sp. M54]|uniref:hypothetical protein n=1 Tax=Streptomyces sp. M54 TaxID=2759525 RepID=UPI001A8F8A0C|nr:hypothetical protein [Streptomyces sp. M54]QSS91122.1 hypothetical protein H3V39_12210 [Streptomyces sp. M54]
MAMLRHIRRRTPTWMNESQRQLSQNWEKFRHLPFPSGFHSRDPDGECMAMMDADLAGCISSAMAGRLDDRRSRLLHARIARLGEILPLIRGDENATNYFTVLHETAMLAAEIDGGRHTLTQLHHTTNAPPESSFPFIASTVNVEPAE